MLKLTIVDWQQQSSQGPREATGYDQSYKDEKATNWSLFHSIPNQLTPPTS
jgi:hypothetical protein